MSLEYVAVVEASVDGSLSNFRLAVYEVTNVTKKTFPVKGRGEKKSISINE